MDQCTREVCLQHWKNIISQCQACPVGQTAKQWMEEHGGICEATYYFWQRKIRQSAYEMMNVASQTLAVSNQKEKIAFAEVPIIKTQRCSIALSADIPESLLLRILREVFPCLKMLQISAE